jgi:serine/threonine protein kinase/WD40 repeat protein
LDAPAPAHAGEPGPARVRYFGDFELVEQIAQGGMGVVWKARQLTINRLVALKMIHAGHLASAEARVRFAAEIEATARLDHPHIVPLYETGEHQSVHFFTMKLLAGGDLTARRADYALPPPGDSPPGARALRDRQVRLVRLICKIARAVHYAHLRGILHRDLKPSNVLLDDAGEPHVADFGLAKMLTRESAFTFTQSILGSPNYMAPEQATGRTDELTTATDVYGLGAIFYELLTGQPPFRAESPIATLRKVTEDPALPPRKINPGIDADLETICLKCLEKSPPARYASALELAEDLGRWLERRPILARRATPIEHAWRWSQREPAVASAIVLCTLLLLTVAVGSSIAALRIRSAEQATRAALRESQVSQARSLRLTSAIGHRAEGLDLLRNAIHPDLHESFLRRIRDELLATLVRTDFEFSRIPALDPVRDPSQNLISPDFNRLASLTGSNTVVIQGVPEGRPLHRITLDGRTAPRLEQFSHDGRFLGVRDSEGVGIWEVESGKLLWRTNGPNRVFAFAPDQAQLVLEEWGHQATLRTLPDMEVARTLRAAALPPDSPSHGWSAIALSPGGRTLTVARHREKVLEWIDVPLDRLIRRSTNRAPAVALAWSPDGSRLAAALANGRVPVFGPRGSPMFDLASMTRVARSLAFNADGSLLAVLGQDRVLRLIDTQAMGNAFDARCDGGLIAFDPTGTRLGPVFRGQDFGWFEMRRPAEFQHINVASTRTEFDGCRYSPDGRIVAVGNERDVVFCDTEGRGRILSRPGWSIRACVFEPGTASLLASTPAGLFRFATHSGEPERFHPQETETLLHGAGWRGLALNADGSRILAANTRSNAAFVFDRAPSQPLATLGPHEALDNVALSPDGRWAATGSSSDRSVRVWKVETGECVRVIPAGAEPRMAFSPDGQWLASSGDAFSLHRVGTWDPAPPLPMPDNQPLLGAAAFSPDSRILAVVCDQFSVQLIDLKGFHSLGLLQAPGQLALHALQFSPDGTQLAATGVAGRLRLWDLRQLRRRLHELGLDRDWPASDVR